MTSTTTPSLRKWAWRALFLLAAIVLLLLWYYKGYGLLAWSRSVLQARRGTAAATAAHGADEQGHAGHDHAGHDHSGHSHNEEDSLELSPQAMRNLGLTSDQLQTVKLQTFVRSTLVPAIIRERPGRTQLNVTTPLTGVVDHVHAVDGEAVVPGTLLFQIRLTHEDLVQSQVDFLQTLGSLDVEDREISRLRDVSQSGAVAGKTLLERQYAKEKLESQFRAQRESLRLHGLTAAQITTIERDRRLLSELQVMAPSSDEHRHAEEYQLMTGEEAREQEAGARPESAKSESEAGVPLVLHNLKVHKGQSVAAGENLCLLADFSKLFIEGSAFERDAAIVLRALENGWPVTAVFDAAENAPPVEGLKIEFLAPEVNAQTRTLQFYVGLPNSIIRDTADAEQRRFVVWKYRPGQRLQLRVPVEEWKDEIVLPVTAVAREGAENYVFVQAPGHFDRVRVHVRYRDQQSVVIANDGSLRPGKIVALKGAHQMLMALKNKAGGGIDPHAGHNH
ncbi:efflux RND transporter periplasmic adaptor subunit [Planctomicrobium sp. SH664]|uniref:efflux RND transporter periplasmic adaptor subunit n=1 Tax=Planctomicrobium sp. SH664 TaxID=3448125 RepID=UPI003F5CA6DE